MEVETPMSNLEQEIERATERLHQARRAMWQKKLSSPEIAQTPPPKTRKPDPFQHHVPLKREVPYVERSRAR